MPVTATEVEIKFRSTPHNILEQQRCGGLRLRLRIWPEARIGLTVIGKNPRRLESPGR